MKQKTILQAVLIVAATCGFSTSFAAPTEPDAFGKSTLQNVVQVPKEAGECLRFEGTYNEPLDQSPTAMLDVESHFMNIFNKFIEVTKLSDKKYRMTLLASTDEGCPLIETGSHVTLSTFNGSEKVNSMQTTPTSFTFSAKKTKQNITLHKE